MTSLSKQVEGLVKEMIAQALEEAALELYRRNVEPILKEYEKQLKELQEQIQSQE